MINIQDNTGISTIHLPNIGSDYKEEVVENNYVRYSTYGKEILKLKDNIYKLILDMNDMMPGDLNAEIIKEINNKLDRIIAILERL